MKYSLLDLTQTILSSMDGDEINSINDNVEAQQVALAIRTAYLDIVNRLRLPEHYETFELTASGDSTKPTLMYLPDSVENISWLKYNKVASDDTDQNFSLVTFISLETFLDRMYGLKESSDNVGSFNISYNNDNFYILYENDKAPDYYTIVGDDKILFDSYDVEVDSTLQKNKTLGYGLKTVSFELSDSFYPDLDDDHFALLLNEAKALCWAELKQTTHQKAEINARRQWYHLQGSRKHAKTLRDFDNLPNFARK